MTIFDLGCKECKNNKELVHGQGIFVIKLGAHQVSSPYLMHRFKSLTVIFNIVNMGYVRHSASYYTGRKSAVISKCLLHLLLTLQNKSVKRSRLFRESVVGSLFVNFEVC